MFGALLQKLLSNFLIRYISGSDAAKKSLNSQLISIYRVIELGKLSFMWQVNGARPPISWHYTVYRVTPLAPATPISAQILEVLLSQKRCCPSAMRFEPDVSVDTRMAPFATGFVDSAAVWERDASAFSEIVVSGDQKLIATQLLQMLSSFKLMQSLVRCLANALLLSISTPTTTRTPQNVCLTSTSIELRASTLIGSFLSSANVYEVKIQNGCDLYLFVRNIKPGINVGLRAFELPFLSNKFLNGRETWWKGGPDSTISFLRPSSLTTETPLML